MLVIVTGKLREQLTSNFMTDQILACVLLQFKDDTSISETKPCILDENVIFHEYITLPKAATLLVVLFGIQLSSKFQQFTFLVKNWLT